VTVVQRHKEEAADYRYFPDPDLVPVTVTHEQIEAVRSEMGELPAAQRARLQSQYGLSGYDAGVLAAKGRAVVAYFEAVAAALGDGKQAANRISDLVFPALSERKEEIGSFPVSAAAFADFLRATASVGQDPRRKAFAHVLEHGTNAAVAMAALGIKSAAEFDESALRAAVQAAVAANPKAVADFKKGRGQAKMAIVGHVMKHNKGAPNDVVRRLVDEELAKG
jgi:aspartyl-tRNA(Asn)/glutamyl-tRNA(Gln) amidotransferase subunit B